MTTPFINEFTSAPGLDYLKMLLCFVKLNEIPSNCIFSHFSLVMPCFIMARDVCSFAALDEDKRWNKQLFLLFSDLWLFCLKTGRSIANYNDLLLAWPFRIKFQLMWYFILKKIPIYSFVDMRCQKNFISSAVHSFCSHSFRFGFQCFI